MQHTFSMAENSEPRPRYFFREWRKHRGYNQEELAEMVSLTASSISQLETGKQGFSDRTLLAIARALQCRPGDLLLWSPGELDALQGNEQLRKLFDRVARAPEEVQRRVMSFVEFELRHEPASLETTANPEA